MSESELAEEFYLLCWFLINAHHCGHVEIHGEYQRGRFTSPTSLLSRLDALDPNAYAAFQASNDLRDVVDRVMGLMMGVWSSLG